MNKYAILLPSYNSKLEEVINTFEELPKDATICVVDDGSAMPFQVVAKDVIKNFSNIEIIRFEKNRGIEAALNAGLNFLLDKVDFIARLDVGDSCRIERFEQQVNFLEKNPDYSIVGCWANFVDENKKFLFEKQMPVEHESIIKRMYINNMFVHPSVMMRSESIRKVGNYTDNYSACEDYDLFFRLLKVGKGKNLPFAWIDYEVNFKSISSLKRRNQVVNRLKIISKNFNFVSYGLYPYYGIARNIMFLFISRNMTTFIQKIKSDFSKS